jgi:hypothetical protein
MQFTVTNNINKDQINVDLRIELLVKALRKEPLELIENQDTETEMEFYKLYKKELIKVINPPFNCRPYRDSFGRLRDTKYFGITEIGKKELKELLFEIKGRYQKSA